MSAPSSRAGVARLALGLALGLSLGSGCATYSDRTRDARDAAQRGDLPGAERALNKLLRVRTSKDLPTEWKKDTALALLERGMVLHARREYKLSARDLSTAEKQLELLDIARDGAGQIGKYVFSDSATKYKAPPSEKLVLNAFNLLNYLMQGDLSGARVEAKRFTTMHDYIAGYDATHPHGAFGSYLAGFVFERLGEWEQAMRYYDEALQARPFASLEAPVRRLAPLTAYRSERIDALLAAAPQEPPPTEQPPPTEPPADGASAEGAPPAPQPERPAELLVVAGVGRVPYKVPERMPIGAAIGYANAYITGDTSLLMRSAFKVVVYPELVPSQALFRLADLRLDGQPVAFDLASDLEGEVVQEYQDIKPKIIGAAISRLIVRAVAAEAARAAGNSSSNKNGALIGLFAALAVEGAMVAADRPDTRSWTLLPGLVFVARLSVPPGPHTVTVTAQGPGGTQIHEHSVALKSGGFSVVDVTTLR